MGSRWDWFVRPWRTPLGVLQPENDLEIALSANRLNWYSGSPVTNLAQGVQVDVWDLKPLRETTSR